MRRPKFPTEPDAAGRPHSAAADLDAAQSEEDAAEAERLRVEAEVDAAFAQEEAEAAVDEAKAALAEAERDLKDAETQIQQIWFERQVEYWTDKLAALQQQPPEKAVTAPAPAGEGTPESLVVAEAQAAAEHAGGRVYTEPTADPRKGHMESSVGPYMRRLLFYGLLIALVGFIANWWWQDRIESERKQIEETGSQQAEQEARQKAFMKLLNDMASQVNAVTDWATNLAGGDGSTISPVLTVDLQKQWIINRPILFLGELRDIAINQDGTYEILVEHNVHPLFLRNSIRVSLRCSESVATNLIQAAKSNPTTRGGDVAITGTIQRVVTTTESRSERRSITVLTGFGKCISAVYLTERLR